MDPLATSAAFVCPGIRWTLKCARPCAPGSRRRQPTSRHPWPYSSRLDQGGHAQPQPCRRGQHLAESRRARTGPG
eukprot:15458354-Alexandrium_andersonii.AAC.2